MQINPLKTCLIKVKDDILQILDAHLPPLAEQSIVAISSKIISLCQGAVVPQASCRKHDLIAQEADAIADIGPNQYNICLTIKNNILIPSAGIDESNSQGQTYILYPREIQKTALAIWQHLRAKHNIKQLGIIITDSHSTPLRRGVTGITLGWCGFEALYSYVNQPDLYDKPLRYTQVNLIDSLAAAAVLVMGEGNEQTPIAIISQAPKITFLNRALTPTQEMAIVVAMEQDLYAPLLLNTPWIKK